MKLTPIALRTGLSCIILFELCLATVFAADNGDAIILTAEVKNLFKKTYFYADGLLAPPRTWVVGLNWRI